MPAVVSHPIEIATFCHAAREPAVDRARSTAELGRAMVSVLVAQEGLEALLSDRFGAAKATEIMQQIGDATGHAWDRIDAALARR
jgi:hypothetical protein